MNSRLLVVLVVALLTACTTDRSPASVAKTQRASVPPHQVATAQTIEPSAEKATSSSTSLQHRTDATTADSPPPPDLFAPEVPQGVEPISVIIPAIGVDAPTIRLGIDHDGKLEVPADFDDTGWFTQSPRPGAPGAAVIAGHVDSTRGPAVFYRLRELAGGDEIVVRGADGMSAVFEVDRIERYPKDDFPTDRVYGYVREPQLRLITCGGEFDRGAGSYRDNVVVYASVADTT